MSTNTTGRRGIAAARPSAEKSSRRASGQVSDEASIPAKGAGRSSREDDVLELIHTVMHQYRARQYRFLRDGPHDITHMDGKVLGFFERHPGATQSDLAQHSGRDKAQLARLIKGLRELGLLDGEADEADRRQTRLTLSAAGQAVQQGLKRQAKQLSARAVAGLSTEEQAQLQALLRRVKLNLDQDET